ncbi:protein PIP82 isoform X2 [Drosophila tropicalis]|uniref:protein PIP82 isoform X2 n=1 Tax=Drosophila tropicalis TaxID=46794 RepID=UPI0035AB97C7
MDFHNLCQRFDVDSLRAKLPALPQIKLPKSLPKLRGRKIFRSSRDNVNNNKAGTGMAGLGGGAVGDTTHHHTSLSSSSLQLPQQQQSQQFINRTPQRISTISSLMHEQQERMGPTSTYCSAGSLDDDYYAPDQHNNNRDVHRPISPIKMPSNQTESGTIERSSLTQRLQRGYKSLSELRLKHLFAKQTTVRRDQIEVDRYVQQYEAELRSEAKAQARRDREIADNYDIRIKTLATPHTSRQNTLDEGNEAEVATPPPTIKQRRSVAEHSGDESGMEEEATPPAARRKPIGSGIAATRFAKVRQPPLQMPVNEEASASTPPEPPRAPSGGGAYKQLLQRLPASLTSLPTLSRGKDKRESTPENGAEPSKLSTLRFPMKSKTSVEDSPPPPMPPADGASSKGLGLRHNIKRLRKSIKRPLKATARNTTTSQESGDEDQTNSRPNSSVTLRNRLSRSTDQLQQRWRKSFKFSTESDPSDANADAAGGASAGAAYLERTFNKLNEKMHQLKFFQRQSSNVGVASPPSRKGSKPNTVGHEPIEIDDEELAATYHHSDSDDDDSGQDVCAEEAFGQVDEDAAAGGNKPIPANTSTNPRREMAKLAELQAKRSSTAWSSESLEEIPDEDYPRVLIHQEHTDAFESTLIIAVATAPPPIPPPPVATNWLPNEKIIASFQEQVWPAPALYKPKSIDIFEASSVGGAAGAFADFDEVLRNAPVLRISADVEEEDEEEEDDDEEEEDDSSSRVTRIRVHSSSPQIGNSRESLMEAQQEDDEEEEEEEEDKVSENDDKKQTAARDKSSPEGERPPSTSPPPPPLPQRRPNQVPVVPPIPIYDAVPPPLPTSRPPLPLPIVGQAIVPPQRSASMSRPSKPLVKTSSLRLTYNEQVRPGDVAAEEKTRVEIEAKAKTMEIDVTRTPTNRTPIPEIVTSQPVNENRPEAKEKMTITTTSTEIQLNLDRQNSNCSRSEYGSPLAYPSSRRSSTPTVSKLPPPPLTSSSSLSAGAGGLVAAPSAPLGHSQAHLRQVNRRSRRSMTRDDDNFYSFDSDEENSYYSISPSGSSRYVVEI